MMRSGLRRLTAMPKPSEPMKRTNLPKRGAQLRAKSRGGGNAPVAARKPAPRDTGFSPAVKLAVRKRAGNGDPERACCEACGIWLGRYGGQVQHRLARRAGGSRRNPAVSCISNAALLCGTPFTGCHGACEARDAHMLAAGWWLCSRTDGRSTDPAAEPVMLHGRGGGTVTYLAPDGTYSFEPPQGDAA